ncbi:class I SAM-dependent methyltransferase [Candidatus Falkowbacteria bacterium]|nr:class I SAM-dependent methyltransferase [Candidatus Falkowbacteria bacterium]
MNQDWEKFAKTNPRYYIALDSCCEHDFWRKGEENFQNFILPVLEKYKIKRDSALDFGCGLGRYTFPLRKYFDNVVGVDVSDAMFDLARKEVVSRNIENVFLKNNEQFFGSDQKFDFIFCANVFQHIEQSEEIENIFAKFGNISIGYCYLQFDTRPIDFLYKIKMSLPDWLLPKAHRHGIRRIRRNAEWVRALSNWMGFDVIEEFNPNSKYHYFLLRSFIRH